MNLAYCEAEKCCWFVDGNCHGGTCTPKPIAEVADCPCKPVVKRKVNLEEENIEKR